MPAFLRELHDYRELLAALVHRDLRVRYRRSWLGIVWAFMEPLLMMGLFWIVFGVFVRLDVPRYPWFVLNGIVVWSFFQSGLQVAMPSVAQNASLIKKIYFPRLVLPLSAVTGRFVHFVISMGLLVLGLTLIEGVSLEPALGLLPVLMLMQYLLVLGGSLLLSPLCTLYEDASFLAQFTLTGLFYLSPVLYPIERVPQSIQWLYVLNPMAPILGGYRAILLGGPLPTTSLGVAGVTTLLIVVVGVLVFRRLEWRFAEIL